jgi:hypothetical protein
VGVTSQFLLKGTPLLKGCEPSNIDVYDTTMTMAELDTNLAPFRIVLHDLWAAVTSLSDRSRNTLTSEMFENVIMQYSSLAGTSIENMGIQSRFVNVASFDVFGKSDEQLQPYVQQIRELAGAIERGCQLGNYDAAEKYVENIRKIHPLNAESLWGEDDDVAERAVGSIFMLYLGALEGQKKSIDDILSDANADELLSDLFDVSEGSINNVFEDVIESSKISEIGVTSKKMRQYSFALGKSLPAIDELLEACAQQVEKTVSMREQAIDYLQILTKGLRDMEVHAVKLEAIVAAGPSHASIPVFTNIPKASGSNLCAALSGNVSESEKPQELLSAISSYLDKHESEFSSGSGEPEPAFGGYSPLTQCWQFSWPAPASKFMDCNSITNYLLIGYQASEQSCSRQAVYLNVIFDSTSLSERAISSGVPQQNGSSANATTSWMRVYGGNGGSNGTSQAATAVAKADGGGYILAGHTDIDDGEFKGLAEGEDDDAFVMKIDEAGSIHWKRVIGGSGQDRVTAMAACIDGGWVLVGTTSSNDGDFINQNHTRRTIERQIVTTVDAFVIRIDANGNTVWSKILGGQSDDFANAVAVNSSGDIILVGSTQSSDGDFKTSTKKTGGHDMILARLSSNGKLMWTKRLSGSSYNDILNSVSILKTGECVAVGTVNSADGDFTGLSSSRYAAYSNDTFVMSFDNSGKVLWTKRLEGENGDGDSKGSHVQSTFDGGYIMTCLTNAKRGDFPDQLPGCDNGNLVVIKSNAQGTTEWSKRYCIRFSEGAPIARAKDGGYCITGSVDSYAPIITLHSSGIHGDGILVMKIDSQGQRQWAWVYGGVGNDIGRALLQTNDEGYLVVGRAGAGDEPNDCFYSPELRFFGYQVSALKVTSQGDVRK